MKKWKRWIQWLIDRLRCGGARYGYSEHSLVNYFEFSSDAGLFIEVRAESEKRGLG
jgi:hypothetical protein